MSKMSLKKTKTLPTHRISMREELNGGTFSQAMKGFFDDKDDKIILEESFIEPKTKINDIEVNDKNLALKNKKDSVIGQRRPTNQSRKQTVNPNYFRRQNKELKAFIENQENNQTIHEGGSFEFDERDELKKNWSKFSESLALRIPVKNKGLEPGGSKENTPQRKVQNENSVRRSLTLNRNDSASVGVVKSDNLSLYNRIQMIKEKFFAPLVKKLTVNKGDVHSDYSSDNLLKQEICDFSKEDFAFMNKIIEEEKVKLADEIYKTVKDDYILNLRGNLLDVWNRVKKFVRAAMKVKKLIDSIKVYGTTVNMNEIDPDNEYYKKLSIRQHRVSSFSTYYKSKNAWVMNPRNKFLKLWYYILLILLLYSSIITPYRICFEREDYSNETWLNIDIIITILFLLDVFIVFNTALETAEGALIFDRKTILIKYLKTWLFLDLVSVFPFYLIHDLDFIFDDSTSLFSSSIAVKLFKLITLLRIIRTMRRTKKSDLMQFIQDYFHFNQAFMRVVSFFMTVIIFVHVFGCFWFYAAKIHNLGPRTWVYELGLLDEDNINLYLYSIYWAFSTISTVGYGDIHAYNDIETVVSMTWMIFGAGFYSFMIGTLSSILANLGTRRSLLSNKITVMDEFVKESHLPRKFKYIIRRALEYSSLKSIFSPDDKNEFLQLIPIDLKFQIAENMYKGLRQKIPFFDKDREFFGHVVPLLSPLKVFAGEVIFRKTEYPHSVYFVMNGRVNFLCGSQGMTFKSYVTGSYFGEVEIFTNVSRSFTARAEIDSDLLTIRRSDFEDIIKLFPEYESEMRGLAELRMGDYQETFQKVLPLIQISRTSKFWDQDRSENYYKIIKMRENPRNHMARKPTNRIRSFLSRQSTSFFGKTNNKKIFPGLFFKKKNIQISQSGSLSHKPTVELSPGIATTQEETPNPKLQSEGSLKFQTLASENDTFLPTMIHETIPEELEESNTSPIIEQRSTISQSRENLLVTHFQTLGNIPAIQNNVKKPTSSVSLDRRISLAIEVPVKTFPKVTKRATNLIQKSLMEAVIKNFKEEVKENKSEENSSSSNSNKSKEEHKEVEEKQDSQNIVFYDSYSALLKPKKEKKVSGGLSAERPVFFSPLQKKKRSLKRWDSLENSPEGVKSLEISNNGSNSDFSPSSSMDNLDIAEPASEKVKKKSIFSRFQSIVETPPKNTSASERISNPLPLTRLAIGLRRMPSADISQTGNTLERFSFRKKETSEENPKDTIVSLRENLTSTMERINTIETKMDSILDEIKLFKSQVNMDQINLVRAQSSPSRKFLKSETGKDLLVTFPRKARNPSPPVEESTMVFNDFPDPEDFLI